MGGITSDAKRKWQEFSSHAENSARDSADYSAAKHCRMEVFLQKCVTTVDTASEHWQKTHESVNDMSSEHASAIGLHV
ncbi:Kinesin-like protein kin-5c, partial [Thalictrum thalictroides]